ncbi:hypothetical protein EYB31_34065 [Paenibacillus thalictri]|uniref:Cytosolic protein n=1 Tax=Paenibacillus thalictri TaxID=2527873 RepID=A0A4Q9DEN0_9BACL|nr:hypothetical protein EYB31_34065 [Paenibacillus thalictri]
MRKSYAPEAEDSYTDLSTVESQRNDLAPEEFPEGPYGSDLVSDMLGKSSPWRPEQRPQSAFTYENRELHADMPREYPGDHETHTESWEDDSGE